MLISVGAEDELSETVARRLIGDYILGARVVDVVGLNGIDSVKAKIYGLNQKAYYVGPVVVLADLDSPIDCPPALVRELSGGLPLAPSMLIRIAVLEIESWVLADREGLSEWLEVPISVIPRNPETLEDSKRILVHLALRSPNRSLREAIAPERVIGTHRTGPGYNETVGDFVNNHWNPEVARRNSPSLDRAISRIAGLASP